MLIGLAAIQTNRFTPIVNLTQRAFVTRWKPTDKLRLFELDPLPTPEDVWRPTKGLHFPEQFYGLYAGIVPVKTYRITKKMKCKIPFHVRPKILEVDLYSEIMKDVFRFKVTAAALTAIEKDGGLDNYLLYRSLDEINSYEGIRVRKMLQARLAKMAAMNAAEKEVNQENR